MSRRSRVQRTREMVDGAGRPDAAAEPPAGVFGWRPFRRLGQAQFAHAAGDALVAVALANTLFFSVPLGEARERVGLYLLLTMAPFAVLAPVVGPLLDRRPGGYRIAVMLAAAGRVVLAVLLSSRTDRLELYPLAFGLLVLSRVHGVSRSALVPDAAPPGRTLMWSNAWLAVLSVFGGVAGGAPGVALSQWRGPDLALWLAAGVFAVGGIAAVGLPNGRADSRARGGGPDMRQLLSPRLLAGGIAMAGSRAAVGFLTFLLAFLLRGADESGDGFVVVVAAAGVGGFVGSVLAPVLRARTRETGLLLLTLASMGAAAVWASFDFDLTNAAVVAGVVGFGSGAGRLAFDSLLQNDAPEAVRGRTFARYETIFQLCWVGGAAAATIIPFQAGGGMRTLAALCVVSAVLSIRGLVRRPPTRGAERTS